MRYIIVLIILFAFYSCKNDTTNNHIQTYEYLAVCFEDFYLNYDVKATPLLNQFENRLIKEGQLSDTTASAYQKLFRKLEKQTYFSPPLKKDNFNRVLLLKSPTDIMNCGISVFGLDSTTIRNTPFSKIQEKIFHKTTSQEEVSIKYFFRLYGNELPDKEIRAPYVKQSILLLLYRWYYKSKSHQTDKIEHKDPTVNRTGLVIK